MINKIILSICLFFSITSNNLFSQHCRFDNAGLLIIELRDSLTGEKIKDNIFMALVDDKGKILIDYLKRPMQFTLNPDKTEKQNAADYDFLKIHYPIAADNYIVVAPLDYEFMHSNVLITDLKGRFRTRFIKTGRADFTDLHIYMNNDWEGSSEETEPKDPNRSEKTIIVLVNCNGR